MADRTMKLLLLAIAVGLWVNVASQWFRPVPVQAAEQDYVIRSIDSAVKSIANGLCLNSKIC